jgi:hypothetical protein
MNGKPDFVYEDSEDEDRDAFLEPPSVDPVPLAKPAVKPVAPSVKPSAPPAPKPVVPLKVAVPSVAPLPSNPFEEFEEPNALQEREALNSREGPEVLEKAPRAASALAETIELPSATIFPHIEPSPYTSKFHHFRFRHARDAKAMETALKRIDPALSVVFNQTAQGNEDVTLTSHGALVGKIQFLHFDRRDQGNRAKYYVKLYFYQFQSSEMFRAAMEAAKGFFMALKGHRSLSRKRVGRPYRKTRKTRPSRRPQRPRPRKI